jgi:hypothetical protein
MLAILVRRASQSTLLVKASQELVLCTTDETRATRSKIKTLVTDLQSYVETFETWGIPAEGSPVNMAKHEAMQEAFREMKELLSSSMAYDTKEILRGLDILGVINQVIKLKAIERGGGSTREKDGMNAASPNQSRPASSVTQIGLLETERAHNLLVSLQSNCWIILGMFVTNNVKNQLYVFHTRTFARLGHWNGYRELTDRIGSGVNVAKAFAALADGNRHICETLPEDAFWCLGNLLNVVHKKQYLDVLRVVCVVDDIILPRNQRMALKVMTDQQFANILTLYTDEQPDGIGGESLGELSTLLNNDAAQIQRDWKARSKVEATAAVEAKTATEGTAADAKTTKLRGTTGKGTLKMTMNILGEDAGSNLGSVGKTLLRRMRAARLGESTDKFRAKNLWAGLQGKMKSVNREPLEYHLGLLRLLGILSRGSAATGRGIVQGLVPLRHVLRVALRPGTPAHVLMQYVTLARIVHFEGSCSDMEALMDRHPNLQQLFMYFRDFIQSWDYHLTSGGNPWPTEVRSLSSSPTSSSPPQDTERDEGETKGGSTQSNSPSSPSVHEAASWAAWTFGYETQQDVDLLLLEAVLPAITKFFSFKHMDQEDAKHEVVLTSPYNRTREALAATLQFTHTHYCSSKAEHKGKLTASMRNAIHNAYTTVSARGAWKDESASARGGKGDGGGGVLAKVRSSTKKRMMKAARAGRAFSGAQGTSTHSAAMAFSHYVTNLSQDVSLNLHAGLDFKRLVKMFSPPAEADSNVRGSPSIGIMEVPGMPSEFHITQDDLCSRLIEHLSMHNSTSPEHLVSAGLQILTGLIPDVPVEIQHRDGYESVLVEARTKMQNKLCRLGGAHLLVELLSSSTFCSRPDIGSQALKFGLKMLEGGNAVVQRAVYGDLQKGHDAFFLNIRAAALAAQSHKRHKRRRIKLMRGPGNYRAKVPNSVGFGLSSRHLTVAGGSDDDQTQDQAKENDSLRDTQDTKEDNQFTSWMTLLQLLCEGHYHDMQIFLSRQTSSATGSLNILGDIVEFLRFTVKNLSTMRLFDNDDLREIVECLELLTEAVLGPCHANQSFLASTSLVQTCRIIIAFEFKHFKEPVDLSGARVPCQIRRTLYKACYKTCSCYTVCSRRASHRARVEAGDVAMNTLDRLKMGMVHPEAIRVDSSGVKALKSVTVNMLHGLIEGRPDTAIHRVLAQMLDADDSFNRLGDIYKHYRVLYPKMNDTPRWDDNFCKEGFGLLTLCNALAPFNSDFRLESQAAEPPPRRSDYGHDGDDFRVAAKDWDRCETVRRALKFFSKSIGQVDVFWGVDRKGRRLDKVLFPIPSDCSFFPGEDKVGGRG